MARKTTWIHDWNKWTPAQRVTVVHKKMGKYSVLALNPSESLEQLVPDQAAARGLLNDQRGHIVAKYGYRFAIYRAFTEKDADISYPVAERIIIRKEGEPATKDQLFKITFGTVQIKDRYAHDTELRKFLVAKFGKDKVM